MIELIISLLTAIINILPASPINSFLSQAGNIDGLAILNWFIPFDKLLLMITAWASCMGIYYLYRSIKQHMKK